MRRIPMISVVRMMTVILTALAVTSVVAPAQSIASKVARVSNGTVRMSFKVRPGICGSGNSMWYVGGRGRTTWGENWNNSRDVEYDIDCSTGPARLVLDRRDGEITDVRFYIGGQWRPASSDVVDLGTVAARDAADYLVSLAQSERGSMGEKAVFPATIADSADVWPAFLKIARNPDVPRFTS